MTASARPELAAVWIADPAERWSALGFDVAGGRLGLGGVAVHLDSPGRGIVRWALTGIEPAITEIDGLPTDTAPATPAPTPATAAPTPTSEHPNGAVGIDHIVAITPDFDRTAASLERAGLPLRRIRAVPTTEERLAFRQGFRRLGPAILELVEAPGMRPGVARFYGLVVIVADLDTLAELLGDRLGQIRDAVQPGRRIATLAADAGPSPRLAFMDPEPGDRSH
jgi:Glyoxalase-like domain